MEALGCRWGSICASRLRPRFTPARGLRIRPSRPCRQDSRRLPGSPFERRHSCRNGLIERFQKIRTDCPLGHHCLDTFDSWASASNAPEDAVLVSLMWILMTTPMPTTASAVVLLVQPSRDDGLDWKCMRCCVKCVGCSQHRSDDPTTLPMTAAAGADHSHDRVRDAGNRPGRAPPRGVHPRQVVVLPDMTDLPNALICQSGSPRNPHGTRDISRGCDRRFSSDLASHWPLRVISKQSAVAHVLL